MSGLAVGGGALLSAAGAATSAYASNQAMRRQDSIAANGIRQQQQDQSQADQVVKSTVQNTATNEQENLQANKQKQQTAYLSALQRAAPTQATATPAVAGASKAYADAAASATKDNAQFGRTLADQMSTTDAPLLTAQNTALSLGDASTKLGIINDTSNRQANVAKLQAQAIQANPWFDAIAGVARGAGGALMAKGLAGDPNPSPQPGPGGGGAGADPYGLDGSTNDQITGVNNAVAADNLAWLRKQPGSLAGGGG